MIFLVFDPFPDGGIHPSGDVQSHFISLRLFWQLAILLKCLCSRKQQLISQGPYRDSNFRPEAREARTVPLELYRYLKSR